jgi:L-lactate dehydrogenase complex protein LldG
VRSETARAHVLSRIRAALGVTLHDARREAEVRRRLETHPRGTIPGRACQGGTASVALFREMLTSQGVDVTHAAGPKEAVNAIAAWLDAGGLPPSLRMGADVVLAGLPWKEAPKIKRRFGAAETSDSASLSRALVGAAETGTLFLVSGADNPTTLAFLPPTHTILIAASDIVGSYEQAWDRLRAIYGPGALPRSVNLISGQSRTADIEQTIVRGAHGPKRLHVVILG